MSLSTAPVSQDMCRVYASLHIQKLQVQRQTETSLCAGSGCIWPISKRQRRLWHSIAFAHDCRYRREQGSFLRMSLDSSVGVKSSLDKSLNLNMKTYNIQNNPFNHPTRRKAQPVRYQSLETGFTTYAVIYRLSSTDVGMSVIATSKRLWISSRTFWSSSVETKEMANPFWPKRPARPTRCRYSSARTGIS